MTRPPSSTTPAFSSNPPYAPPSADTKATTTTKKRRRVILFNGWLRQASYPRLWMKPLAEHLLRTRYYCSKDGGDDEQEVEVEVLGNTMPAQTADAEKYIQHLADLVGPGGPNEDTYFIGQSIGCQVILRYLARLPPGSKVRVRRSFCK
jgi:pimeloyl-ACP methyl ester carboxylesterase